MKELSQNPDYETMWKVECELNKELQEQNKELANLLRDSFRYSDGLEGFYVNKWKDRAREALVKVKE